MVSAAEVREFHAGELVGNRLRVEAPLGEGGAAAVYRVRDEGSGRKLALKQLRPPADERRALVTSQFEREYYTLAQLAHPRIIEVFDYGFAGGSAYYTMELLDGEDLRERGKLPWRHACALLRDVASSLAIVHSRGLVHRDVSARNIRCTADGRAKLIDFGAMVPMGGSQRLVGTPPFTAPEAVQLQALDGRADLYGLGAVAYWTLTGRHAYPARSFNQLRDLWRTPAPSPRDYEPELPPALCELVLSLLRLDRAERPSSAAEVMERLSGIAGLALSELPQVGRAYLIMPKLVGRDALLQEVRAVLLQSAQSGHGGGVLMVGAPGSGRSRLLDACTLEAKLMGATVLRAGAADAASGDYGVARALCGQLLSALPEPSEQNATPRRALLAQVLPQLADASVKAAGTASVARRHIQAGLRDFLLAIARTNHVVIAVDDCESVDEPSAAWLGALAHGAGRRRLTLLLTTRTGTAPGSALELLAELLRTLEVEALQPAQTHALLRSLFGDSEHLVALADRVHQLSHGNPRRIMSLAEHLVARGLARYEAGSWSLPMELSSADLPASDREANVQRIASLSAPARALADVLSLTEPGKLALPDFATLSDQAAAGHSFGALDELVAAGILIAEGERYRFGQSDVLAPVEAALEPERRRALHARLARVFQQRDAPAELVQWHMLRGGHEREAIDQLLSRTEESLQSGLLDNLQLALEAAQTLRLPDSVRMQLQYRLVRLSPLAGRLDLFERHGWPLIERLERDSGLCDWYEQDDATPATARLANAFERARQRYAEAPEAERGFTPQQSVMPLCALYGTAVTVTGTTHDSGVLDRLRSLAPWESLSPMIGYVNQAIDIQRQVQSGRHDAAVERCERLLEQLTQVSTTSSPAVGYMRLGQTFLLAVVRAGMGDASYSAPAAELERLPGNRGNAWRVRAIYERSQSNLERARECERRSELLDLQDTGTPPFRGMNALIELQGHAYAGDLLGVKRIVLRLEQLVARFPAWQPTLSTGRCRYKWLQGQLDEALEALQPALASVAPGRHIDWQLVIDTQIALLVELGRHAEASALGEKALADCDLHALAYARNWLTPSIATALTGDRQFERARELLDTCIDELQRSGIRWGWSWRVYASRARLALAMRDEAALRHYAELCAKACGSDNPTLQGVSERLLAEWAAAGGALAPQPQPSHAQDAVDGRDAARTVYSRMLTCISPVERAQTGLQLLLEATGAKAGHLYGLSSGALRLLSSADEIAPPAALAAALEDYLRRQFDPEMAVLRAPDLAAAQPLEGFEDELGREFSPLLLCAKHQGEQMVAGVAALYLSDDERPEPRRAMLDAVIEALIAQDIVDPITTHIV
jgi:hypothetical protein